ncbi:N-acetylmuramoyl-L-alanine amidase [Bacillus mesophilus]|nr:cell wall hydrolase [Bacillus mesophilus]MBM7661851.1 N-acetylmuramoyl-L-alanine amidase [Bacillus mesophilus]
MNTSIRFLTILILAISLIVSSATMINQSSQEQQTKLTLKKLYEQDLAGQKMPTYQFLTEELSNKHLNEEEMKNHKVLVSEDEKKLLARLVTAEAKGEPYSGKVAVAEVVLNRVEDEKFPDSIKEVIYEENQFEPVQNNSIQQPADQESVQAVEEALIEEKHELEALYFYNPETASDHWIRERKIIKKIGNHVFAI